jgi:RNA ligase (TIGR02306 family)
MSFFGVTKEKIAKVLPHNNADRLELLEFEDMSYQCVAMKGLYKAGDEVLYFPIDSILTDSLIEKMGLTGKLSGSAKNRVKTVKLRGEISQGLVGPISLIDWAGGDSSENDPEYLTNLFKVIKYEPPFRGTKDGNLKRLPFDLSKYDIEGAERNRKVVEEIWDVPVCITEKVEGSNFSSVYDVETDQFIVNQRRHSIEELPDKKHVWCEVARQLNLEEKLRDCAANYNLDRVVLYGEMVGPRIQGNYYRLKSHDVLFFDMMVGTQNQFADRYMLYDVLNNYDLRSAPVLHRETKLSNLLHDPRDIREFSSAPSLLLSSQLREGIVIVPEKEMILDKFGRAIIKQRDPVYLAKTGA